MIEREDVLCAIFFGFAIMVLISDRIDSKYNDVNQQDSDETFCSNDNSNVNEEREVLYRHASLQIEEMSQLLQLYLSINDQDERDIVIEQLLLSRILFAPNLKEALEQFVSLTLNNENSLSSEENKSVIKRLLQLVSVIGMQMVKIRHRPGMLYLQKDVVCSDQSWNMAVQYLKTRAMKVQQTDKINLLNIMVGDRNYLPPEKIVQIWDRLCVFYLQSKEEEIMITKQ